MKGCKIPKILPYKTLMSFVKALEIGEVLSLEDLALETFPAEASCDVPTSGFKKTPACIASMARKELCM